MDEIRKAKIEAYLAGLTGKKKLSDFDLSEVFIIAYGDRAIYCSSWGQFLIFEGKYYKRHDAKDIKRLIAELIINHAPKATQQITDAFLSAMYNLISIRFPTQVEDTELAHEYFAFEDGIFNTDTFKREDFTSKVYCFKYIGVKITDFTLPAPHLTQYLQTTLKNASGEFDEDLFAVYQEMCGSLFAAQRAANRAFFLYGEGANGKSITTELILSLFEEQYVASASLESLSQGFGRARLIGKVVNICSEEESQHLKQDVFKALVTGESIDARRLYENSVSYHNFAKLIFATNNFPKFGGLDYSTRRRIVIIPFNRIFAEHERDYGLLDKLLGERAQFVNMALKGLKRLQANNYQYSISEATAKAMDILQEESSSVARYINEEVVIDETKSIEPISARSLYAHYKDWCKENGHQAVASSRFARETASVGRLSSYKVRKGGVNKFYVYPPQDDLPPVITPQRPLDIDL